MSEGREQAQKAFDTFLKTYGAKYPKGTECLLKDRDPLLVLYDFPAEHWIHIQTTNPIESTLMFKLGLCAEKRWRKKQGIKPLGSDSGRKNLQRLVSREQLKAGGCLRSSNTRIDHSSLGSVGKH